MNAPEPAELAGHWLATALGDLRGAEGHLRDRVLPARQAAELAQGAAEKALKGAIIFGSVAPPRTHDLAALARLVPADWRVHSLEDGLAALSGAYREARYPRFSEPPIDHDEATRLVSDARRIVEAILEDLLARGVQRPEPL